MQNLKQNVSHLIMGAVTIVALTVLAYHGTITGGEAFGGVLAAGGFSLGAGAASASPITAVAPNPDASVSTSPTVTSTPTASLVTPTRTGADVTTVPPSAAA
jgi:hypothetical protein